MDIIKLYKDGMSIPEVSEISGLHLSTIRYNLKKAGVLRSRADGVKLAAEKGKLGSGRRGKKITFSDEWKENISKGRRLWSKENAKGLRITSSGYVEFTKGKYKGRLLHVVIIEKRIKRKLLAEECVHHVDMNKLNNKICNLRLMKRKDHNSLHAKINNKKRKRDANGRYK